MNEKDLKKYAKAATVTLVDDRPKKEPDLYRVVFGEELNGFNCDVYAKDPAAAREAAIDAYKGYLKVTGAIEE